MPRIGSVFSTGIGFVSPLSMAILGALSVFALTHSGKSSLDDRASSTRTGRAIVRDTGETVSIALDVADADNSTVLKVLGLSGEHLATIVVHRNGASSIEAAVSDPVPFILHRGKSRFVDLGARSGRTNYAFHAGPDGEAEFLIRDADGNPLHRVFMNRAGEAFRQPDASAPGRSARSIRSLPDDSSRIGNARP